VPQIKKPSFRADHVGSLLRPQEVKEAREQKSAGTISAARLREIEDEAIVDAVALQQELGIWGITDGEFRRQSWSGDFLTLIENVSLRPSKLSMHFRNSEGKSTGSTAGYFVDGKMGLGNGIFIDHFEYLKSVVGDGGTPKLTIPSPTLVHFRSGREGIDKTAYPTMDEFFADLASVYCKEVDLLVKADCKALQVDDTNWAYLCDDSIRPGIEQLHGMKPEALALKYAELMNRSLESRSPEMVVGMHVCRGNNAGMWMAEGGYEPVSEIMFNAMDIDKYFLEYDTDRAGDFKPLRFVPKGKTIILGLLSSKTGQLESKDELKRRIDEAAKYVPVEQLGLSPQCGFSSVAAGNPLTMDDQRRKLARVVEVVDEIWGAS
jgi:5-methyltetrahydropteroyltriglutamate--homocysteine methyltransferase